MPSSLLKKVFDEPLITTFSLQGLVEILQRYSVDPDKFLARYDLTSQGLEEKNTYISYWVYAKILRDASEACNCPHLGLYLSHAETHSISTKSMLGMLLNLCDTVGEAIEAIIKYYNVVSSGARYELHVKGEHAWFIRKGLIPELSEDRILQDLSLCDFVKAFQNTIDMEWSPEKLFFSYPSPKNREPYDKLLKCPIQFNASKQAIQFQASLLKQKGRVSETLLRQLSADIVSWSKQNPDQSFRDIVTQAVDIFLPTGVCGARSVATLFNLHPRTLRRQLQKEGGSFANLLEARRKVYATFYLKKTNMTINEISLALGYSAPEAFTRAFRRWYTIVPSEWRISFSSTKNPKELN